jgi:hypothetical protein
VENRIDHQTFVRRILSTLILGMVLVASGCAPDYEDAVYIPSAYDHPFTGRMIVEQEALPDVLADDRCQHAWNGGRLVYACSWHFDDPLNPGAQVCHVVHPKVEDGVWTTDQASESLRVEMADCNGWHDRQVHDYSE